MKTRIGIVMLFFSISVCTLTCDQRGASNVDEKPRKLPFAKYYKPYEPNVEPVAASYKLPLNVNNIVNISKINKVIEFDSISSHNCPIISRIITIGYETGHFHYAEDVL
jgi:hypothetical protein